MKTFTIKVIPMALVIALSGCASKNSANWESKGYVLSYTGELLKYRCGGYRPDAGQPVGCAPQRPSLPEGYSKDSAGYRTPPAPPRQERRAPTPTGYAVKAYRVGPHVDPSNPRIVQGAHTAYQIVGTPGWNLHTVRRVNAPAPQYAPTPAEDQPRALGDVTRKAEEADRRTQDLQQRVSALEDAQKANTAAQNANQQLIVDQINALKARTGQPLQPGQADPNQP